MPTSSRIGWALSSDLREGRMYSEGAKKARARIEALKRSIQQLEARRTRLMRSLEHTDDPHGAMLRKIRDRMSEIETSASTG